MIEDRFGHILQIFGKSLCKSDILQSLIFAIYIVETAEPTVSEPHNGCINATV